MARMGSFKMVGMAKFRDQLNKLEDPEKFTEDCTRKLAARMITKVVKRTPVGDYSQEVTVVAKRNSKHHKKGEKYKKRINPSGKMGGTLRRGWTAKTHEEAENGQGQPQADMIKEYVASLPVNRVGSTLQIDIINPVEYASYVESGHRQQPGRYVAVIGKRLKKAWVSGQFMMKKSADELQNQTPGILKRELNDYLKEAF